MWKAADCTGDGSTSCNQYRPVNLDPERSDRVMPQPRPGAYRQIIRSAQPCVPFLGV